MNIDMASVQRRKVKTGNPSHGTSYKGFVHTFEPLENNDNHTSSNSIHPIPSEKCITHNSNPYSQVVAICGVPPEQVPEGVLNFARSYRKQITHVRVLIMNNEQDNQELEGKFISNPNTPNRSSHGDTIGSRRERPPTSSFMEDAAAISGTESCRESTSASTNTLYMVLLSLVTPAAAKSFVQNQNGKPFNSFENNIASVYHVVHIEGDDSHCSNSSSTDKNCSHDIATNKAASLLMSPSLSQRKGKSQHSSSRHRNRSPSIHSFTAEVQNCPVCLDPMDIDLCHTQSNATSHNATEDSAIFTTVCNHTFHMHCLLQWEDAPCPVCRFDHAGLNETLSQCHICRSTDRVYVCLICGVASCSHGTKVFNEGIDNDQGYQSDLGNPMKEKVNKSRDSLLEMSANTDCGVYSKDSADSSGFDALSSGHAKQHYDETLHAYAVDTTTQHVWDFAGQGFVHRLIQNVDGKIVEVSDPANTTSQERSLVPGLTDAEEGEIIHRKLEGYANEYNNLLKDQLEQQRRYFEGVLHQIKREHEVNAVARSPAALIIALKQDLHQLQQRTQTLDKKSSKVSENVAFLKNMNESLEANKEPMQKEIKTLQQARIDYGDMLTKKLPLLEERVSNLMLELE